MTIEHDRSSPKEETLHHLGDQFKGVGKRLAELAKKTVTPSLASTEAGKQAMLEEADRLKDQASKE